MVELFNQLDLQTHLDQPTHPNQLGQPTHLGQPIHQPLWLDVWTTGERVGGEHVMEHVAGTPGGCIHIAENRVDSASNIFWLIC